MKNLAILYAFKITRLGSNIPEINSLPFELIFDFKSIRCDKPNNSIEIISQNVNDIPWQNPDNKDDRGTIELVKYEVSEDIIKDIIFKYQFQQWCPYRKQVIIDQCLLTNDSLNYISNKLYDSFAQSKSEINSNHAYTYNFTKEIDQLKFLKWITKYYKNVNHIHDKDWRHALGTIESYAEDKLYDSIKNN